MISESDNRHLVQIKQLIWFYGVSTVVDWIIIVGQRQCLRNGDIICVNNRFLEVKNNLGALLALSFDMSSFAYAFVMWYIFFYTPNRFGKLTNLHGVSVIMDDQLRKSMTLERQEEQPDQNGHHQRQHRPRTNHPEDQGVREPRGDEVIRILPTTKKAP